MTANLPSSVKLDPETRDRLQRLATARRRSAHWLMREAIAQFVDREEKRDRFYADGQKAWANYEATGLHVTFEEADAWLAKLEEGEDAEPPTPHT